MSRNVYQRIAAVMQDVAYLQKDDKVETGGGKGYKAITEEKVTGAVRSALVKHGLVICPVRQTTERTDEAVTDSYGKTKINRVTTVEVLYRVQNVDDPADYIEVASSGTGVDTQDKGVGKAMTYAYKYMLLRTFAIPTGEDPDKISSDVYSAELYGEAPAQEQKRPRKKEEAPRGAEPIPEIGIPATRAEHAKAIQRIGDLCVKKWGAERAGEGFVRYSGYKGLKDIEPEAVGVVYDIISSAPDVL